MFPTSLPTEFCFFLPPTGSAGHSKLCSVQKQQVHPVLLHHLLPPPSLHTFSSPGGSGGPREALTSSQSDCKKAGLCMQLHLGESERRFEGWRCGGGVVGGGEGPCEQPVSRPAVLGDGASLNSQPIFCPSQHFIPSLELSSGPGAVTG